MVPVNECRYLVLHEYLVKYVMVNVQMFRDQTAIIGSNINPFNWIQ